jgi:hypothetical protein
MCNGNGKEIFGSVRNEGLGKELQGKLKNYK